MPSKILALSCLLALVPLAAQEKTQLELILERLAKLEAQNEALQKEVNSLRQQLNPGGVPLAETVEVQKTQIREQAQSKVEAASKQPLAITGTLLMNSYWNGRNNGGAINSSSAALVPSPHAAGITASQTIIGLRFESPQTLLGADVTGYAMIDFFDTNARTGTPPRQQSRHLADYPRLRVANLELAWKNTSLSFGQEKPLISQRDPTSLAQVGIAPATGAGNPWLWQPQVRIEQRFNLNESTQIKAQGSIYQTAEESAAVPAAFADSLAPSRPGWQGRLALNRKSGGETSWEIAPVIHASTTQVAATGVASRLYGVDWLWAPTDRLTFTGLIFSGKNIAHMGTNRQGFTILGLRNVRPTNTRAGWGQVSYQFTPRLAANLYSGQHDDRNRDLATGAIGKNFLYAGNLVYRIATNLTISFEASQVRTDYIRLGRRLKNHYDLALAYQF
ncbi:MAG: hypothetical protein NTW74_23055 [Acidobacteria bacterium]|nr:hypothetical protein [Acidobacteriota bacterium]